MPASAGSGGNQPGRKTASAGARGKSQPTTGVWEASNFAQGKASVDVNRLK